MKTIAFSNDTAKNLLAAASVVWRDDEGPLENFFRLVSYTPVLFAGLGGLALTVIDKIVSYLWKLGIEDFGAWLDEQLGNGPKSDVSPEKLREVLMNRLYANAKANNGQMIKVAGLGGIFKLFGGTGKIVNMILSFIMRGLAFLTMALGAANMSDVYEKIKGAKEIKEKVQQTVKEKVKDVGREAVQEMFQGQIGDLGGIGDIGDLLGYVGKNRS